jgi:hypothetical protein
MKNKVREEKTISEKGWRGIDHPLLEHAILPDQREQVTGAVEPANALWSWPRIRWRRGLHLLTPLARRSGSPCLPRSSSYRLVSGASSGSTATGIKDEGRETAGHAAGMS